MWRDGILQQQNSSSSSSAAAADAANSTDSSGSNGSDGSGYTLTQNPGVFASNFVPLWAGVAAGDVVQGSRVVEALQGSGLVQPAGGCKDRRGGCSLVATWFLQPTAQCTDIATTLYNTAACNL